MSTKHPSPQKSADTREKGATLGHGSKSDAVKESAILALLSEKSITEAAKRCGVNERTLPRWLTDDDAFKAEYEAARSAAYQAGISRIQALTGRGIETLEELLDAKKFPAVRLARLWRWASIRRESNTSSRSSRTSKRNSAEGGRRCAA